MYFFEYFSFPKKQKIIYLSCLIIFLKALSSFSAKTCLGIFLEFLSLPNIFWALNTISSFSKIILISKIDLLWKIKYLQNPTIYMIGILLPSPSLIQCLFHELKLPSLSVCRRNLSDYNSTKQLLLIYWSPTTSKGIAVFVPTRAPSTRFWFVHWTSIPFQFTKNTSRSFQSTKNRELRRGSSSPVSSTITIFLVLRFSHIKCTPSSPLPLNRNPLSSLLPLSPLVSLP